MSLQGAPSQSTLWAWLEKDIANNNSPQQIPPTTTKTSPTIPTNLKTTNSSRNDHRKIKKKKKQAKQQKTESKKIHFNEKTQKNRMYNYLKPTDIESTTHQSKNQIKDPAYFGEVHTMKADGDIRIWFTNPCGIGIRHDDIKSYDSFRFLRQKSRCDIFGLSETNVHWHKLKGSSTFYSRVKQAWHNFRTITCHNTLEDLGVSQRGGNCMAVTGQISFRMTASGRDARQLGRWIWMEFSGRDKHITRVYTAYRPGLHKPPDSKNTTVYDQHDRYLRTMNIHLTPRELFDKDIRKEIMDHIQLKNVILMLDGNEDMENGPFNDMMNGVGMRNGIQTRIRQPMPPTHHRGSRPISAIYCSRNLVVTRAGILPIGVGVRGDHKNMYIDIQTKSFLGGKMYKVVPPPMRTLQLSDSRIYLRFIKLVKQHLHSNNILEKAQALLNESTYPATHSMVQDMEKLDDQMGRAIKNGLKKCRKLRMGAVPFSALFNTLSRTNRLWLLVLKKRKGQRISNTTIRRLARQVGVTNPMQLPMEEIIYQLRTSKKQYELFVPHAPTERQQFYEDLASANAMVSNQKKLSILKNIMQTESSRQQHAIIRSVFPKKNSASKKVDRVQVLKEDTWEEITTPSELIDELQKENKQKYSCTNTTPLMDPYIHSQMGNFAEGALAKEIQHGHVDPKKIFDTWTSRMLSQSIHDPSIPRIPIQIKDYELKDAWRISKENKAASPSGRYNATYKAMCQDDELLRVLTLHINLPFKLGQPYQRWSTFLDIMAFKKANSTRINTLRSIIISEGDWNVAGRIYVTRRMMQQAEELKLLPEEHLGGRKGRKSIDGAITKRIFLDNSRLLQKPAIILSTDAANCYDRMVHKFVCMMCKKWGLEESVLKALLQPLQNAKHYTRTAYGDSPSFFSGDNLQGAGQGNTSAAPFWTCVSSPMITLMKENGSQAKMRSPLSLEDIVLTLMAFVDDTEVFLMVEDDDIEELLNLAHSTLENWKSVLQATGGDMRSKKCAWILLQYSTVKRSHRSFTIRLKDEDGITRTIDRYGKDDAREYLGVLQQASGEETEQLQCLHDKVEIWNTKMSKSRMSNIYNQSAVFTRIHKSLQYPLPATTLKQEELKTLSNKLYETCLPKCGINRKFPIELRDLPARYHGLSLPNLYLYQETSKIMEILSASDTDRIMWKQYKLGLEILQLQTGTLNCVLNNDYSTFSTYIPSTWITSQWKFLWENKINVQGWQMNIKAQRYNDESLMSIFIRNQYSDQDLQLLNECRMFLNAITVSDVVDGDGIKLCPMAMEGRVNAGRSSQFDWNKPKKPSTVSWYKWREALRSSLCTTNTSSTLRKPLGSWTQYTHNNWKWLFHSPTQRLYHLVDGHCRVYRPSSRRTMNVRNQVRLFKAEKVIQIKDVPTTCTRASAEYEGLSYSYAKYYGSASTAIYEDQSNRDGTAYGVLEFSTNQKWICRASNLETISEETLERMMEEPLRIVADGSYKDDHSSMAVIIETESKANQIIALGPVPANKSSPMNNTDAYRSEMAGLLAGLTILGKMEEKSKKTTPITLSCDNDTALQVATTYSFFNSRMKHYDMARALINKKKTIHSPVVAKKVIGHADVKVKDRKLTRTELLNQSCDRLAKIARQKFDPIGNVALENEGLSLWHDGKKMNHDIRAHLEYIYNHRNAEKILSTKYGWSNNEFQKIDWQANEKAMTMMTNQTRIWIAKRIAHFLPVGRNMKRMHKWTMNHCPRCEREEETHDHLLQCKHDKSRELLIENVSKIRDWLEQMSTPHDLGQQIIASISKYLQLPSTIIILPHTIMTKQHELGNFEHFMMGHIHSSFSEFMSGTYKSIGDNKKTGILWTSGLIQRIWTLIHRPIWALRNKYVHEKLNETKTTRNRDELESRVATIYETVNKDTLLARDRDLFQKPLRHLLLSTDTSLKAWVLAVEVACKERDKEGENDILSSNATLHKWMHRAEINTIRKRKNTTKALPYRKKRVSTKTKKQLQHTYTRVLHISQNVDKRVSEKVIDERRHDTDTNIINDRRGHGEKGWKRAPYKKRVSVIPRKRLQHTYIRIGESLRDSPSWGNTNSIFLHRTGFYKPP